MVGDVPSEIRTGYFTNIRHNFTAWVNLLGTSYRVMMLLAELNTVLDVCEQTLNLFVRETGNPLWPFEDCDYFELVVE